MDVVDMVNSATNEMLFAPDLGANIAIIDRLNANPDDIVPCLEAVADRIDSGEPNCVVLAIALLDMLMKNVEAGTNEYLDALVEVARCPATSSEILKAKDAALDFIQFFGGRYSYNKQLSYAHALHALRVKFPPPRADDTWTPPDAPKPSQATGRVEEEITSTNLYHKITQLRESLSLLDEIVAQKDAGESEVLRDEMTPQCKALHASFIRYLEDHGHELQENTFAQLLSLNDSLSQSIKKAEKVLAKATLRRKEHPHQTAASHVMKEPPKPTPAPPVADLLDLSFSSPPVAQGETSASALSSRALLAPSLLSTSQPSATSEPQMLLFDFPAPPPYTAPHQTVASSPSASTSSSSVGSASFLSFASSPPKPAFPMNEDADDDPFAALATRTRPASVSGSSLTPGSPTTTTPPNQSTAPSAQIGSLL